MILKSSLQRRSPYARSTGPGFDFPKMGRWLLVKVEEGWSKSSLFLRDLSNPEPDFVPLTAGKDFLYDADILDGHLYITTNEGATRYRVLKAPCSRPESENWKQIIPEAAGVLEQTQIIGRRLFLRYSRNAISELKIADLNGKAQADVSMPTLGSIFAPLGGKWDGEEAFFGFTSFAIPPTVYRVSLDGVVTPWAKIDCSVNPDNFHVEQVWFSSKDGTRVPMFIVSKQGGGQDREDTNAAFRLRWFQRGPHARIQPQCDVAVAGKGRHLCRCATARWE